MSKVKKEKKPRSEKQLANDKRLGDLARAKAARLKEPEFEPTAVKESKREKEARELLEAQAQDGLREPAVTEEVIEVDTKIELPPVPTPVSTIDPAMIAQVAVAVAEVMKQNPQLAQATPEQKLQSIAQEAGAQFTDGQIQGMVQKYSIKEADYPNPSARLLKEPKIQRFAPVQNFIFKWNVDGVQFRRDNVSFSEPRFTLELYRRLFTDEGEPSGEAALVNRMYLHEDDYTAKVMAIRMGIWDKFENKELTFNELMNEIRFERFRQWLVGLFTPPSINAYGKRSTTQVINGKVTEVFDAEFLTDSQSGMEQGSKIETEVSTAGLVQPSELDGILD